MVWTIDVASFTFGILIGIILFTAFRGLYHLGKEAEKNEH